jgi:para-aminobenzoate synthetase component 1
VRAPVPLALVGGHVYSELLDVTADTTALDHGGQWVVVVPFDGPTLCARFACRTPHSGHRDAAGTPRTGTPRTGTPRTGTPRTGTPRTGTPRTGERWIGPRLDEWVSSLDRPDFEKGVLAIHDAIRAGDVYQVNLTRLLRAPLPARVPTGRTTDITALGETLAQGNPAPWSAVVRLPDQGIHIASASPELFLQRSGRTVRSMPIKGTATTPDGFTAKDRAENVMIVDLVRNDLGRVCEYGSVDVPLLLGVELHPGLAHLVTTVTGRLRPNAGWAELLGASFPPGSVTGTPKEAALTHIARLEPVSRGPYCGAIGWVDAERGEGALNVAIRTFWIEEDTLCFGTGGAITIDSDPSDEWAETELKARHLVAIASEPAGEKSVRGA